MDTLRQISLQESIEERFDRKHIDAKIRKAILENPEMAAKVEVGITTLVAWMSGTYYKSKMHRLAQLQQMDARELVMDVLVGVAYSVREELFATVVAKIAARLKFDDRAEAITTVAEMLAVLCEPTDAYDINKASVSASLMLQSKIPLPKKLIQFVQDSQYLPPMVCKPLKLKHNFSSGYLTHNDSLILGSGNHHNGDICLDVLNIVNSVALKLDTAFLSDIEEEPTFVIDSTDKADAWKQFKKNSYRFYALMVQHGNKFYLTHKPDKRGRLYSCGYHISTQGTAFKKACLDLANEEVVTGVPT